MNLVKYVILLLEMTKQVTLPCFGKFELEFISVEIDTHTGKTLPPRYNLSFTQQHNLNDRCLANEIAQWESIDIEKSNTLVYQTIFDWKNTLKRDNFIFIENLGTFIPEKEKIIFQMSTDCFVNDKNFGLPII